MGEDLKTHSEQFYPDIALLVTLRHFTGNPNNFQLQRDTEETTGDNDKRARMRYWGGM